MAPKRKCSAVTNDEALTYFINELHSWTSTNASLCSYKNELILDAHQWGECMVRAELKAMTVRGTTASYRLHRLRHGGEAWYTAGYRMCLLPQSKEVPLALKSTNHNGRARIASSASESTLRDLAVAGGRIWWTKHSADILNQALRAVEVAEKACAPLARARPARAPIPILATVAAPSPTLAALPRKLHLLLTEPANRIASNPVPDVEEATSAAFLANRTLRVWNDGGTEAPARALSHTKKTADVVQRELQTKKLGAIYAEGWTRQEDADASLAQAGLTRIACGGFNSVWVSNRRSDTISTIFDEAGVAKRFDEGKLVLRVPHLRAPWLSFHEAVGEASNMLFTALSGCGPRVALLSFAQKLVKEGAHKEEVKVTKYKIFAFLDRATESVDKRFALDATPVVSAQDSGYYLKALLVCIYKFSHQGFVHLDGTLRNFVDFYPRDLPASTEAWRVNVIDVERKSFRRLVSQASTDWRDIFLVNLLVVLTFLKLNLGSRWNPALHWHPVRNTANFLIKELSGRNTLPAIAYWSGAFVLDEPYPDMLTGKYLGNSHEAAMHVLTRQMRYYMLQQPLENATSQYTNVMKSTNVTKSARDKAVAWYDRVYRVDVFPAHRYFYEALTPRSGPPQLLVQVLFKFLSTAHVDLQKVYARQLAPCWHHQSTDAREYMLGL
jgi:hypothetical protein